MFESEAYGTVLLLDGAEMVERRAAAEVVPLDEGDPQAAIALSMLLIGVAVVVVVGLGSRRLTGRAADG